MHYIYAKHEQGDLTPAQVKWTSPEIMDTGLG